MTWAGSACAGSGAAHLCSSRYCNEAIWRTQTTDFWVNFKLFGFVPLTFAFAALQYPLLMRYATEPAPAEK